MMTVADVADRTGYTPATIRLKIRSGVLPALWRGNMYMISETDLYRLYAQKVQV